MNPSRFNPIIRDALYPAREKAQLKGAFAEKIRSQNNLLCGYRGIRQNPFSYCSDEFTRVMNQGSIKRPLVFRASLIQLILLIAVCCILWPVDNVLSYSALLGGSLVVLPNVYFAFYAFRFMGSRQASIALHSIYRGEMGKFTLTLVGFALVFLLVKPLHSAALFGAFIVATGIHWIVTAKMVTAKPE